MEEMCTDRITFSSYNVTKLLSMPSVRDINPMQNFPLGLAFPSAILIQADLMGLNSEPLGEGSKQ